MMPSSGAEDAQSLAQLVAQRGALGREDALDLVVRVLDALAPLHGGGEAHGAVDPDHVFVGPPRDASERARVSLGPKANGAPSDLTWWMAPEQMDAKGVAAGPASDVWSVALVAFFALTGQRYWFEIVGAPISVASRFIVDASERAREYGCGDRIPPGFDGWFARCLAREPASRFANADAAKTALADAMRPAPAPVYANNPYAPAAPAYANPYAPAPAPPFPGYAPAFAPASPSSSSTGCAVGAIVGGIALVVLVLFVAFMGVWAFLAPRPGGGRSARATPTPRSAPASPGRAGGPAATIAPRPVVPPSPPPTAPHAPADPAKVYVVPIGTSPILGPRDALVTVVEISDFQCPFCKRVVPTLTQLRERYASDVRLVWKDDPLPFHTRAEPSAELAREARAELDDAGFWRAHDAIFASSPSLEDADLDAVAATLGLKAGAAHDAIAKHRYLPGIQADTALAASLGATGTPTFFINGRMLVGAQPLEKFAALVDEELKKAKARVAAGTPRAGVYDAIMAEAKGAP